jgi:DNA-binding IclR family transcriptional regulator
MPGNAPFKSVLRALDVLELIGMSRNGLQLKHIDVMLGENAGGLHTLLQTLVGRGYLTKLEDPIRYVLGPALGAVDQRRNHDAIVKQVGPIMIDICRQSGMVVMYQRFIANYVVVQLQVQPKSHLVVDDCGWLSSPYGTAVIFQAYQTPKEQDRYWAAHAMNGMYQRLWGTVENIRQYLKMAAQQRLAIIDSRVDKKFRVAGPILDSAGKAVAAIAAIQDCSCITPEQARAGVREVYRAAIRLSSPHIPQPPAGQYVSSPAPVESVLAR